MAKYTIENMVLRKSYKTVYNYFCNSGFDWRYFEEDKRVLWVSSSHAGTTIESYAIIFSDKMRAIKVETLVKNAEQIKSFQSVIDNL